ncbi:DUF3987 domain-containing protein, partial [Salmonella enterica]|nr:DUF3987 domain-containing protein [Salmonella enterica]
NNQVNNDVYDPDLLRIIAKNQNLTPEEKAKGKEPEKSDVDYWHKKLFNIPAYTQLFDWIGGRMRVYSPELCFAATLSFFGAKIAGRATADNGEMTSNLMVNALAKSATGKSQALRAIKKALRETGDADRQKVTEIKSDGGLKNELIACSAPLISIDEVGLEMKKWSNPRSPEPVQNIKGVLMTAYTGYSDEMTIGKRADSSKNNDEFIKNPCPSIFGVSTPAKYWDNLSIDDVSSGFLNRQIIIDATDNNYGRKKVKNSKTPAAVVAWSNEFMMNYNSYTRRCGTGINILDFVENPIPMAMDDYSRKLWEEVIPELESEKVIDNDELSLIWARLGEMTLRIAIQVELVENPQSACITGKSMMRAYTLAKEFIQFSYSACSKNLGAGLSEKKAIKFVEEIKSKGVCGISATESHQLASVRAIRYEIDRGARIKLSDIISLAVSAFGVKKLAVGKRANENTMAGLTNKKEYYIHSDFVAQFTKQMKDCGLDVVPMGRA